MAVPTWIYNALERVNTQEAGGFTVPYTVIIDAGKVTAAYHDTVETNKSQPNKVTFRHEYDLSDHVICQAFQIADEHAIFSDDRPQKVHRVAAMFYEKISPISCASPEAKTSVAVDYMTPRHTLNFLHRGSTHAYPQIRDKDVEEMLMTHASDTKQRSRKGTDPSSPSSGRSGILQRFDVTTDNDSHCRGVILHWVQHQPTTVVIPTDPSDWKRVSYTIEARRNKHGLNEYRLPPYQRCVTVDGPSPLSVKEPVTPALTEAVCGAAKVVISKMQELHNITAASLMFRQTSSGKLFFLYAPLVQVAGDVEHPPLKFCVPAQFRSGQLRPRSEHLYEEDLIEEPKLGFSPGRLPRQCKAPPPALSPPDAAVFSRVQGDLQYKELAPEVLQDYDSLLAHIRAEFPLPLPSFFAKKASEEKTKHRLANIEREEESFFPKKQERPLVRHPLSSEALRLRSTEYKKERHRSLLLAVLNRHCHVDEKVIETLDLPSRHKKILVRELADERLQKSDGLESRASVASPGFRSRGLPSQRDAAFVVRPNRSDFFDGTLLRAGSEKDSVVGTICPLKRTLKPVLFPKEVLSGPHRPSHQELLEDVRNRRDRLLKPLGSSAAEGSKTSAADSQMPLGGRLQTTRSSQGAPMAPSRSPSRGNSPAPQEEFPELADFAPREDEFKVEDESSNTASPLQSPTGQNSRGVSNFGEASHRGAALLEDILQRFHKQRLGVRAAATVEEELNYILMDTKLAMEKCPHVSSGARDALVRLGQSVTLAWEFMCGLNYQLQSRYLASDSHSALSVTGEPGTSILLFSIPPSTFSSYVEQRLLHFIRSMFNYFEYMTTTEHLADVERLLLSSDKAPIETMADELFASHMKIKTSEELEGSMIFAVKALPPEAEVRRLSTAWVMEVLCVHLLERREELLSC